MLQNFKQTRRTSSYALTGGTTACQASVSGVVSFSEDVEAGDISTSIDWKKKSIYTGLCEHTGKELPRSRMPNILSTSNDAHHCTIMLTVH